MDYKLIATDMDGTLLTGDKRITPRAKAAIALAKSKGAVFTIATGRPYVSAKRFIDELELSSPVIIYNGCRLVEPDGRVLSELCLSMQDARRIFELSQELDVTTILWSNEKLYANRIDSRSDLYRRASGIDAAVIDSLDSLEDAGITKILWMDSAQRIGMLRKSAEDAKLQNVNMCTSDPEYLEFFSAEASKGAGLMRLAQTLGIDQSQVIALGDEENDISMLQYAGMGVAMGNASERIKGFANMVTDSCDEEGFAKALEKLFN